MGNSMTKYREMEEQQTPLTENGMSTNNTTLIRILIQMLALVLVLVLKLTSY